MKITKENAKKFVSAMNRTLGKLTYSGKTARFYFNEMNDIVTFNICANINDYYNCLTFGQVHFPLKYEDVYIDADSFEDFESRIMVCFIEAGENDLTISGTLKDSGHRTELRISQWSIDLQYVMQLNDKALVTTDVTIAEKSREEDKNVR